MKKKFLTMSIILIIFSLVIVPKSYGMGFAGYDDATADAEAKNMLEQQELEHKNNLGKSNNNYLTELSVEGYTLIPSFDKQIINYEIDEEITSSSINIIASLDDEKAKISGNGIVSLQSGENNIDIEVTAESGTVRTYHIKLNKKVIENGKRLAGIKVFGVNEKDEREEINITPEFSENIFLYSCKVHSDITKIIVEPVNSIEGTNVKVEGNEKLQLGKNEITIHLMSNENTELSVYKINIVKEDIESMKNNEQEVDINYLYIIGAIIFILIVLSVLHNKKRKHSRH